MNKEKRRIVTPGETVISGLDFLPGEGTYRNGENINAAQMGLTSMRGRMVRVIPLSGRYVPKEGDKIIGVIQEVRYSSWTVEINSPYDATLTVSDGVDRFVDLNRDKLNKFFDLREAVLCKVRAADPNGGIMVSLRGPGLRKLTDGRLIEVSPAKIPRIIGKGGSMISLIKRGTNCQVFVGQNGRIWINGDKEEERKVIRVIKKIEAESHLPGLTEKIREMLGLEEEPNSKDEDFDDDDDSPQEPPVPQGGYPEEERDE